MLCVPWHHAFYLCAVCLVKLSNSRAPSHQKQLVDELALSVGDEIEVMKKWVIYSATNVFSATNHHCTS